jgi:DNA-binding IclR family transcriptional regulator
MHLKQENNFELLSKSVLKVNPQFSSTLGNGLDVLQCFMEGSSVLGNKDISKLLGLSKPTISRLLFTLVALGFLQRNNETGKYSLGASVLTLSYPLLRQLTIRELASQDMVELAKFAKGPVSIGIRDRLQVVYIETTYNRYRNNAHPDIGSVRPLLRTAIGKSLLYKHTKEELGLILERLKDKEIEEWQKFKDKLYISFEDINNLGFCTSFGDWRQHLYGVAVPFKNKINGYYMAMNVTVSSHSSNTDFVIKEIGPRLIEVVENIESKL